MFLKVFNFLVVKEILIFIDYIYSFNLENKIVWICISGDLL